MNFSSDSRINAMTYQKGSNVIGTLNYVYDGASRRTQLSGTLGRTGLPPAMSSATYDVADELTSWNGTTISYDSNGNIANDGAAAYTWNARNQLTGRGGVSYQYDVGGRRTLNAAGNNLLYDGSNVTQELSSGTPVANRIVGGTDEFFSRTDSGGTYTPITDALGSVLGLTDSSGNLATQYTYDPFGNTTTSGAASSNKSQYTGRENDGNGLYYYRARYYSPSLHRFVSQDPIGFVGGSANLYAYALNSPTNLRDPSGKSPCLIGGLIGAIGYDGYVIYQSLRGRSSHYAGLSGAWNVLSGTAQAAGAGCLIADGAFNLFGEGAAEAAAEETTEEAASQPPCPICFPAGTPIRTRSGLIPIQKIKIGDEVLSRDQSTGKLQYKRVTGLTKPHLDKLLKLRITGERDPLMATPKHPFFVRVGDFEEGKWVPAGEMKVGDKVLTKKGTWTKVTEISPIETQQTVYNFEVEDNHDYFVGSAGLLVHNDGPCDPDKFTSLPDAIEQAEGVGEYADTNSNEFYDISTGKSTQAVQNILNRIQSIDDIPEDWEDWF